MATKTPPVIAKESPGQQSRTNSSESFSYSRATIVEESEEGEQGAAEVHPSSSYSMGAAKTSSSTVPISKTSQPVVTPSPVKPPLLDVAITNTHQHALFEGLKVSDFQSSNTVTMTPVVEKTESDDLRNPGPSHHERRPKSDDRRCLDSGPSVPSTKMTSYKESAFKTNVMKYFCPIMGGFCHDGCQCDEPWDPKQQRQRALGLSDTVDKPTNKVYYTLPERTGCKAKNSPKTPRGDPLNVYLYNSANPLTHRDNQSQAYYMSPTNPPSNIDVYGLSGTKAFNLTPREPPIYTYPDFIRPDVNFKVQDVMNASKGYVPLKSPRMDKTKRQYESTNRMPLRMTSPLTAPCSSKTHVASFPPPFVDSHHFATNMYRHY